MSRDLVNAHCARLPGAERSDPWGGGHDAWKVGGKLFALVGAVDAGGVSVKCADAGEAAHLIDLGLARRAPYLHRSWVSLRFDAADAAEIAYRLDRSYGLIRAGLPRRVQAALG
jgi:predicted DNA-binding protein (MmcQ/YjbR family)